MALPHSQQQWNTARKIVQGADTTETAQACRGAACIPLLSVPASRRLKEQLTKLAHLLNKLQALQLLPVELCQQLAAQATLLSLPSGAAVIEEDEIGDAMYVVLSGQCQVRARPMHAAASEQQPQAAPETAVTAEQSSSSTDSSDSDNDVAAVEMSRQAAARRSEGEHPATYWIHKYMEQARKTAQAASAEDELSGLPLPLVARVAGHWRARVKPHREPAPATLVQAALTPMEQLLGRGAVRAMTSGAQAHQSAANVLAPNLSLDLALTASPESSPARAAATDHPDNSNAANAAPPGVKQAALSNAPGSIEQQPDAPQTGSVQPTLHSLLGKDGDTVDSQGSFLVSKDVQSVHQHVNSAGKHGLSVVSKDVQSEQQHARQPFRREQQDQDGVTRPRHGLSDPNKRLLAQMGSSSAANASRELMQEVGARANVQGLLQDMAGRVRSQQQGSGKVTRQESFKVSQMVHQRLGTAASSQGFGPHATQVMATDSLDTLEEELDSLQGKQSGGTYNLDVARTARATSQGTEPSTEQTSAHGRSWSCATEEELEAAFGKVIRTVTAGESFGELALLQQTARRTASVLTAAAGQGTLGGSLQQNGADGSSLQQNGTSHGSLHGDGTVDGSLQGDGTVNLLRIAREDYNAAVKAVRLQQLGLLLDLLQGVPPFAQLPHDKLISLAIFVRPITCTKDCVIAREGDAVDTMYIIQQGEVRLTVRQDTGATPRPYSANAQLGRSASASMPHLSRASSFQRSFRRSSSFAADAQVAVLGPGDSFGDEVCGLGAPEAISSNSGQLKAAHQTPQAHQSVTHLIMATASCVCTLLAISATDLAQLGASLTADMQIHAQERRAWRTHRIAACRNAAQVGQQTSSQEPAASSPKQLAGSATGTASTSGPAYHDLTKRNASVRRKGMSSARRLATDCLRHSREPHGRHQSLDGLMDDVTAATFRSCALQHFTAADKGPDSRSSLKTAGLPQAKAGSSRPQSAADKHSSKENQLTGGSTSLSLQHLLAGLTPNDTPRPGSATPQSPSQTRPNSRPGSAGKPPRPTSAGARPVSGRLRPTSATLASIPEDCYASELSRAGTASPLFPEYLDSAS